MSDKKIFVEPRESFNPKLESPHPYWETIKSPVLTLKDQYVVAEELSLTFLISEMIIIEK